MPAPRKLLIFILSIACSLPAIAPRAQESIPAETGVDIETLHNRLQEAEASSDLDEDSKSALLDLYRRSISLVEQRQAYEQARLRFADARESAPRQAAEIRAQLERLEASPAPELADSLKRKELSRLEQLLLGEKADLSSLAANLTEQEARLETLNQRAQQARERLNEARKRQLEITEELQLPVPEAQLPRMTEARAWVLQLESGALASEIAMIEQELLSQPMRIELAAAQRDLAALQFNRQRQYLQQFDMLLAERRRQDAESAREAAAETERQAFGKHPLLQQLAERNTELGEELNRLADALEEVTREEHLAASEAKRVADNYRLARQKLEIAGLSEALGQVLLEQRRGLQDAADLDTAEKRREQRVVESSLRQIRNQQERGEMRDINAYVDEQLAPLSQTWQGLLRAEVLELAEKRRELLDKAIAADETYLQALNELDLAQRQLSEAAAAYNGFLAERLLWVRTGDPPSWQMLQSIAGRIAIFFDPEHWVELLEALLVPDDFPWILLLGLALFLLLQYRRKRLREALESSGRNVGQMRHDRYIATLRALLLTLVLAAAWPVLFTALGLHLQLEEQPSLISIRLQLREVGEWTGQFVPAIGAAFYKIALYVFYFSAFRIFCERGGLAVVHLGWDVETTLQLRRETGRLMKVFLPATFVLISAVTYDPAALAGGASRLFFVVVLLSLAWYFGRILMPKTGVLREFYAARPNNPLTWLRYLWLALGLLLLLSLAVLVTLGYVYTAAQFGSRLIDSLWLLLAIILFHQLVVRWVLLTERRLVFQDLLERHRAQRAARDAGQDADPAIAENTLIAAEETGVDYVTLSANSKKMINAALAVIGGLGLWAIWSDVLPAFRILDDVSLWSYTTQLEGVAQAVPVTLGDAIVGLLIVAFGIIAARHLPSLIEIALLTRLNISFGSRYAISKLTQYTIVAAGIVMVFSILGGRWSEIQWLVAALGVGIGFGLQEIVANFICGLILLFERPIRIGDVVTVGETSGVVTRIRIRSTTIRNWDQKELLVPNKEFITGRLLNWTLTDPMARIVIEVGVAYGSDVLKAMQLVQQAAQAHDRVVNDPEPLVTFENFGDSALIVKLRCYIESMDYRLQTQSELNQAIYRSLEKAGIVIAFPQRDIHLDTSRPLDIRIQQPQPDAG